MNFFRQYILPLLLVLVFFVALVAVSARIFLPSDLAAPAPIERPIESQVKSGWIIIFPGEKRFTLLGDKMPPIGLQLG